MPSWNESVLTFAFVSVALKSSAVLCAAGVVALFLRRRSAAVRHLIWSAAFVALFALPFFSALPAFTIPVPARLIPSEIAFHVDSAKPPETSAARSQSPTQSTQNRTTTLWIPNWRIILLVVWCAGTLVSLGQMLAALAAMQRIRRDAHPLAISNFASLAACLDINSPLELFESPRGNMLVNFGLRRQAIFLPSDVLEGDKERSRLVILHELAHVKRHDATTHVLARAVLSIYWWNPLAWLAWREFLKERERATDDLVLSAGARPSEYANHLLEIATGMQSQALLASAAVAMARRSQLEGRLIAILENGRNRRSVRPVSIGAGAILAILIAAPLAALQAENGAPSRPPTDPVTAQLSGDQASTKGIGLLKIADLEYEQGKFNVARPLYTKAILLLGNSPQAVTALIHLGAMALIDKNPGEAIDDFSRAQALNSADGGRPDMWMAIAQEQDGFPAEADSYYQSALKKSDPNSALAATIMELYAQFLTRQGRAGEAQPLRKQSAEIRKALGAQALSATQNTTSNVYKIGGDVTVPVLLSKVEPEYSQDARAAKYQGTVLMYVEIGTDGAAHNIRISRGLGLGLDEKAIQAVTQWKFKPSTKDGQPVTVRANIEVNFRLL
jgi:TonB family protein